MSEIINERVIFFILNDNYNIIEEYQFTKHNEDNKIVYTYDRYSNMQSDMNLKKFKQNYFDSSNLSFCWKIGNKLRPKHYIEWLFENKNKYEINKGKIYKLSKIKNTSDTFTMRTFTTSIGVKYTQEELLNIINMFENIEVGEFTNDYTKEYYNKNVIFNKN